MDTREENDAGLEIAMKIWYIYNGRKKLDIAEILDRIIDVKIISAPRLTSRKGSGGVIFL
ncbi:MAG: hypothetical protein KJ706_09670 [Candidatus Omnitrophica bacterium]|nr:hypothetical protein [Candidatus Omnitrophota bacterium]MBU4590898.1 hypothetical protein [Candidatus Omnitrophota bacterium]